MQFEANFLDGKCTKLAHREQYALSLQPEVTQHINLTYTATEPDCKGIVNHDSESLMMK